MFPPLIILHILQLFLYNGTYTFRPIAKRIEYYLMHLTFAALINNDTFSARFLGNTFWFIAISYYIYITFLGYASKLRTQRLGRTIYLFLLVDILIVILISDVEILHKTHLILSTLPVMLLAYITTLCAGINISYLIMEFYRYRAL